MLATLGRPPIHSWEKTQEALEAHDWNVRAASGALGISERALYSRMFMARARGQLSRDVEDDCTRITSTSTLYDEGGNVRLTWIKEAVDKEKQLQMVKETVAAFVDHITPAKLVPPPKATTDLLCSSYLIGDVHLGCYAWGKECGESVDTKIVSQDVIDAAHRLVASTPASDEALMVQLGDFYHMDSSANTTFAGTNLDVDTRFPSVVRTGITTMCTVIDLALTKHKRVRVRNTAGNHDTTAYIGLVEALRAYYRNEPRVIIEDSPRPFWIHRWGSNLIGVTHGHTVKPERMPGVLAVDGMEHWSSCDFKYVWHGHFHTKKLFEDMGVIVECFRTTTSNDKWHTEQGYRSGKEMQAIVLHRDYGEVERHTAGLKRVRRE